jgi:hypothetical protein
VPALATALDQASGFCQQCGNSSSMRLFGWLGRRSRTSRRHGHQDLNTPPGASHYRCARALQRTPAASRADDNPFRRGRSVSTKPARSTGAPVQRHPRTASSVGALLCARCSRTTHRAFRTRQCREHWRAPIDARTGPSGAGRGAKSLRRKKRKPCWGCLAFTRETKEKKHALQALRHKHFRARRLSGASRDHWNLPEGLSRDAD